MAFVFIYSNIDFGAHDGDGAWGQKVVPFQQISLLHISVICIDLHIQWFLCRCRHYYNLDGGDYAEEVNANCGCEVTRCCLGRNASAQSDGRKTLWCNSFKTYWIHKLALFFWLVGHRCAPAVVWMLIVERGMSIHFGADLIKIELLF